MSSIMIFIFIIYNIFNTTNNGEKLYVRAVILLLFEKKLNACATKSFKYEYLIQDEPYQHQPFCNNLHFFFLIRVDFLISISKKSSSSSSQQIKMQRLTLYYR